MAEDGAALTLGAAVVGEDVGAQVLRLFLPLPPHPLPLRLRMPLPPLPPIVGLPLLLFEADGAFPLLFLDLPVFPAVGVGGRADGTV